MWPGCWVQQSSFMRNLIPSHEPEKTCYQFGGSHKLTAYQTVLISAKLWRLEHEHYARYVRKQSPNREPSPRRKVNSWSDPVYLTSTLQNTYKDLALWTFLIKIYGTSYVISEESNDFVYIQTYPDSLKFQCHYKVPLRIVLFYSLWSLENSSFQMEMPPSRGHWQLPNAIL